VVLEGGLPVGTTAANGMAAGWAQVKGERWQVSSAVPVAAGQAVRVTARNGLTLTVVPVAPVEGMVEQGARVGSE